MQLNNPSGTGYAKPVETLTACFWHHHWRPLRVRWSHLAVRPPGDAGLMTGTLGGSTISGTSPWAGKWTPSDRLNAGKLTVTVRSTTAVIVRIRKPAAEAQLAPINVRLRDDLFPAHHEHPTFHIAKNCSLLLSKVAEIRSLLFRYSSRSTFGCGRLLWNGWQFGDPRNRQLQSAHFT